MEFTEHNWPSNYLPCPLLIAKIRCVLALIPYKANHTRESSRLTFSISTCPVLSLAHFSQASVQHLFTPLDLEAHSAPSSARPMECNHTEIKPSEPLTLPNSGKCSQQLHPLPYLKAIVMAADAKMFEGNLWTVSDLSVAVSTDSSGCSVR